MHYKKPRRFALVLLLGVSLSAAALAQDARPAASAASTGNARVDKLLSQMTLQEKISLIHGKPEPAATSIGQAGYLPGLKRLGVPALRTADGPNGVLVNTPSTGMTATMGLAATFSRADAKANGEVVGKDARALGVQVVLEPNVDMFRNPGNGTAYNNFGEDPFLSGEIAAAQITGTQAQGVMAQIKHFVADAGPVNVVVPAQALHEIYLTPFAAAAAAKVATLQCVDHVVNGGYVCGDGGVLSAFRAETGFNGIAMTGWSGARATENIAKGLDLEMPGEADDGCYFCATASIVERQPMGGGGRRGPSGPSVSTHPEEPLRSPDEGGLVGPISHPASSGMLAAIKAGTVDEASITRAAGRILLQMDRFGFLDTPPNYEKKALDSEGHAPILRKTAQDAAVLLKNDKGALPLTQSDLASLAIIGPGGGQLMATRPAEKGLGIVERQIGPLEALKKENPGAKISYAVANDMTGTAIPAEYLTHDGKPGLARATGDAALQIFSGVAPTVDAQLDFTKKKGNPLPKGFTGSWSGEINIPKAGAYRLYLQLLGGSGSLSIDGRVLGRSSGDPTHGDFVQPGADDVLPTTDGLDNVRRMLELTAGPHKVEVKFTADASGNAPQVRLAWVTPEQKEANYAAAIKTAKSVATPIVFAWHRGRPNFGLPGDQDQLISDIADANPNTIVVLNTSNPLAMPWLSKVKAVLVMWDTGDEGGWATADILTGKVSPAGRLPFTWGKQITDYVSYDPAHPERTYAGVDGKTTFSEGIFMGYRWFDQQNMEPVYPFGHGLSYTKFAYSKLASTRTSDGGADVTFEIRNTGKVASDEVPQVYVGPPAPAPEGAQFAKRSLVAFDRVHLKAGETKSFTFHIPPRQLSYWDERTDKWSKPIGDRPLYVGASSRDIKLTGEISSAN
ncbi:glycoside hydrolase family 3 C-terminal domain-containing protein [Escherichia coli]